jgi:hypothetical protein
LSERCPLSRTERGAGCSCSPRSPFGLIAQSQVVDVVQLWLCKLAFSSLVLPKVSGVAMLCICYECLGSVCTALLRRLQSQVALPHTCGYLNVNIWTSAHHSEL